MDRNIQLEKKHPRQNMTRKPPLTSLNKCLCLAAGTAGSVNIVPLTNSNWPCGAIGDTGGKKVSSLIPKMFSVYIHTYPKGRRAWSGCAGPATLSIPWCG